MFYAAKIRTFFSISIIFFLKPPFLVMYPPIWLIPRWMVRAVVVFQFLSGTGHIARPTVAEIPMLVVDEFKIR